MTYEQNDKLDCLIKLAYFDCGKRDAEMFESIDTSDVVLSNRLNRRIKRLANKSEHEKQIKRTKIILSRAIAAVLIVMSIMLVLLLSISATRNAIWEAIIEWYEEYFTVDFQRSAENNGETGPAVAEAQYGLSAGEYLSESVTPPKEIEEVRKPTYLPEGAVEEMLFQSKTAVAFKYYIGDDWFCTFNQMPVEKGKKYFDNVTGAVQEIDLNGTVGVVVTYSDNSIVTVIWYDNEYLYNIFSDSLRLEEIILIAKSVT